MSSSSPQHNASSSSSNLQHPLIPTSSSSDNSTPSSNNPQRHPTLHPNNDSNSSDSLVRSTSTTDNGGGTISHQNHPLLESEDDDDTTCTIHIKLPSQHTLAFSSQNLASCTIHELKMWIIAQLMHLYRDEVAKRGGDDVHSRHEGDASISNGPLSQYKNLQISSIRLIFRGKFLDNNSRSLVDYKLEHGDAVHCVVSREGHAHHLRYEKVLREREQQRSSSTGSHRRTSSHLNTDSSQDSQQPLLRDDNTTDHDDTDIANHREVADDDDDTPRGFDQLREAGIPEEEIQEMRSQFYGARPDVLRRLQNRELTLREVHEMEEEWMQEVNADGNALLAQTDSQNSRIYYEFEYMGTNYQLALGILMGFLFGVIMLIWVLDGSVSFKFKYGLFVGLCSNFLLTLAGGFFA